MENYDEDIFMLWRNRPCILIGRYQNIDLEVNLNFTNANNMDVIRRLSGGGAIYCDTENKVLLHDLMQDQNFYFQQKSYYLSIKINFNSSIF